MLIRGPRIERGVEETEEKRGQRCGGGRREAVGFVTGEEGEGTESAMQGTTRMDVGDGMLGLEIGRANSGLLLWAFGGRLRRFLGVRRLGSCVFER